MYLYVIYFLILILFFVSIHKKGISDSFLDIGTTKNFNGLFVLFVFFAHFSQYVGLPKYIDFLQKVMGQLIVAPFLFVSGYGVTLGFLCKQNYKKTFLSKRIRFLYLQFAVAVALYCFLDLILTKQFNLEKAKLYLCGFSGLRSVGNSNWYVVAILVCYLTSYLGFSTKTKFSVWVSLLLIFIYVCLMAVLGFDFHWYNTVLAYFAGEIVAFYKDKILMILKNISGGGYICTVIFEIMLFSTLFIMYWLLKNDFVRVVFYNLVSVLFCILFVTLTFKFSLKNSVFTFLGNHAFSIYILQRLPMILVSRFVYNDFLFLMISIVATLFLALSFDCLCKKVLRK